MLVYYIGNFTAPWCTEVHLARELRGLGCTVVEFQEPSDPRDHKVFLRRIEDACAEVRPDLLMFTRTWGLPAEATALWRFLETKGIVTCSYHLDLYLGLKRANRIAEDPFWTTQHVFTPDGDPISAETFAAMGINHHWSPPAVVSDECYPGTYREDLDYDVVFVGSYGYHNEWPWRVQLIDYLHDTYGTRFRRFGGDQPEGPIRGQALNDLYASAKVVVGDSLHLPGHTRYFTDRYFETVGRGGFLIAPYVEGIMLFLTDYEHLVYYGHPMSPGWTTGAALGAVGELIDSYLQRPEERDKIQLQGQAHVRQNHTYRHRLIAALETMGLEAPSEAIRKTPALTKALGYVPPIVWDDEPVNVPEASLTFSEDFAVGEGVGRRITAMRMWTGGVPLPLHINKLELGSGYHPTPGFTHLDINPNCPDVDIVGPAWPLDLTDNSVGELRAVDVLEHLSYRDTDKILADWFRVLEPGGKLYVQVPDAAMIMLWFTRSPDLLLAKNKEAQVERSPMAMATWLLLGGHHDDDLAMEGDDWRYNAHYALFSVSSLTVALDRAGFVVESLDVNDHPNIMCWAVKS